MGPWRGHSVTIPWEPVRCLIRLLAACRRASSLRHTFFKRWSRNLHLPFRTSSCFLLLCSFLCCSPTQQTASEPETCEYFVCFGLWSENRGEKQNKNLPKPYFSCLFFKGKCSLCQGVFEVICGHMADVFFLTPPVLVVLWAAKLISLIGLIPVSFMCSLWQRVFMWTSSKLWVIPNWTSCTHSKSHTHTHTHHITAQLSSAHFPCLRTVSCALMRGALVLQPGASVSFMWLSCSPGCE